MNQTKNDTFSVTVARTIDEVLALKEIWESFDPIPVASINYFLAQLETKPEFLRPYVMELRRGQKVEGLLVARVEDTHMEFKFGHKVIFRPTVRSITLVEEGLLGQTTEEHCQAYIEGLINSLRHKEADIASFKGIGIDTAFLKCANSQSFFCKDHFPVAIPRYMLTLPATFADFFKGRKKSKKLRGLLRRLENHHPGEVEVRMFTKEEEVDTLCSDAETVSQKTYLHALGEGFVCTAETRALMRILAREGKLRCYIIYIKGTPGAYLTGYSHCDIHYDTATGFDPAFKKFELGTILMLREIEELCEISAIGYIDNGPGDQWYKRRFCDLAWDEASFFLFAPSIRGMKLNALRMFAGAADHLWNNMLTSLNLKEKWAKYKRDHAQKSITNENQS